MDTPNLKVSPWEEILSVTVSPLSQKSPITPHPQQQDPTYPTSKHHQPQQKNAIFWQLPILIIRQQEQHQQKIHLPGQYSKNQVVEIIVLGIEV